jgi:20S proteasome subunit alpha 2
MTDEQIDSGNDQSVRQATSINNELPSSLDQPSHDASGAGLISLGTGLISLRYGSDIFCGCFENCQSRTMFAHMKTIIKPAVARALLWCFFLSCWCDWLCPMRVVVASANDGRYSYSLSFFDPQGKLGQVERANQAAARGIPILVLTTRGNGNGQYDGNDERVIMAAPHVLPNALTIDSGTMRFAQVSSTILMAHSGLTADGRVLMTAAQRLAVEHEYVFDEDIPIAVFLEEMSLLFQEYTMKEGVRPFAASLIVASLSTDPAVVASRHGVGPQIYRIDPSGSVTALGSFALVNGGDNPPSAERMRERLAELYSASSSSKHSSVEDDLKSLVGILQDELQRENADDRSPRVARPPNRLGDIDDDAIAADDTATISSAGAGASRFVTIKTAVLSRGNAVLQQKIHHVPTREK